MSWGAIAVAGIGAVVNMSKASENREDAKTAATAAKIERDKQQARLDKQISEYKGMKFKNPFDNMENVFEDLTVNQQQAQFEQQQASQQRANIMQNLKGAAGASGVAGLAQALANQGALQTQRISASIGQQESRNQMARARGAAAIQASERQGDQWVQQAKMDRQATILGMQMGQSSGANTAHMQSQANQMNAQIASQQVTADMFNTTASTLAQNPDAVGNLFKKS